MPIGTVARASRRMIMYGYLNQARSSRRLAREAARNVDVMWLLKGLEPGYRTIGNSARTT
jgi:transposase